MISSRLLGPKSGRAADCFVSGREQGYSKPPFDQLNLSWQVGDDPVAVAANRVELAREIGVEPRLLFAMRAAHGGDVAVIDSSDLEYRRQLAAASGGRPEPCWDRTGVDALVTAIPGIAVVALAADCATVALADPDAGVAAVLHCGWKGLGAGVVANTIATMRGLGADTVGALVGPTICAACYRVDASRAHEVQQSCSVAVGRVIECLPTDGGWSVDIGAGVTAQLQSEGVRVERVLVCPACDADGPTDDRRARNHGPRYFSYRRDGRTGRHGAAVVLRAAASELGPLPGTISR